MSAPVVSAVEHAGEATDTITVPHDGRHIRRKRIVTDGGLAVMVDLSQAIHLHDGNVLRLSDGSAVKVVAARENLLRVTGRDGTHFAQLCWHIGNRHLAAQIDAETVFIQRDAVIATMLEGLGATVEEVELPFQPVAGAYHHHD